MKRILLLSIIINLLAAAAHTAAAQEFTELYVSGPCNVSLVCSVDSTGTVIVQGGVAEPDMVDVRTAGDALYVVVKPEAKTLGQVNLRVYTGKTLRIVSAQGRATVSGGGYASAGQLSLVAAGASSLMMSDLSAGNINVSLSGSGKVMMTGEVTAETVNLSQTGSGRITIEGLAASTLSLTQRGSGKITVAGSARKCSVAGLGTGNCDVSKLVSADMTLKLFGNGHIYYPAGVRVTTDGHTDNIISVKPYQPL